MRLSTKGRYGLRAVVDLAVHATDGAVSISSIARRQGLSESYLEQLISRLKKAGIVTSMRGTNGGYRLAKTADHIFVGDILRALEGKLCVVECPDSQACDRYDSCVTKYVWKRINDSINNVVNTMTLEEVIKNGCSTKAAGKTGLDDEDRRFNPPDHNDGDSTRRRMEC